MNVQPFSPHSWIEISKSALEHNISFYRKVIGANKTLAIVIKSNAYGHGMVEIGTLLEQNADVDYMLVAHTQEAVQLREAGITKPILLLNPDRSNTDLIAHYNCETIVTDSDMLQALNDAGKKYTTKVGIHVKVDTGLSRFGFAPQEIVPLLKTMSNYPWLQLKGLYTHFAESNNSDLSFTHEQEKQFYNLIDEIEKVGIAIPFFHTSNSAGITSLEHHSKINFMRLGAGAYGLWPSEQTRTINWKPQEYVHLKPVLSWKTKLIHIKKVAAHTPVGYNRTSYTTKETIIGVLPVGYYDGLDKRLSNKGVVHLNGQSAPITGTISMNATMIDLTHIATARLDDTVTLLGNHPLITAADLAQQTGCFNTRQITVQINPHLPRIIVG